MYRIVGLFLSALVLVSVQENAKYGKFDLIVNNFSTCKGPKPYDCSDITVGVANRTSIFYNFTLLKPVTVTKGKIIITANGRDTLRLQMKNPCKHLHLRTILMAQFNMTSNCAVQKGNYQFYFDINKTAMQYFGGSFVYGNMSFTTTLIADNCNFSCTVIGVNMQPKATS